ncbi:MAG: hypothetical protein ACFFAO_14440 [Candidatus Hermodarchaeota archaeon]
MSEYSNQMLEFKTDIKELMEERDRLHSKMEEEKLDLEKMKKADFLLGGLTTSLLFLVISILIQLIETYIPDNLSLLMNLIIMVSSLSLIIFILSSIYSSMKTCRRELRRNTKEIEDYIDIRATQLATIYDERLNATLLNTLKDTDDIEQMTNKEKAGLYNLYLKEKKDIYSSFNQLDAELMSIPEFSEILLKKMREVEHSYIPKLPLTIGNKISAFFTGSY